MSARRFDYTVRALGIVLGAAVVHFAVGQAILTLLRAGGGPRGESAALTLVVAATALGALAVLYVRTQYSSSDHVARSVPWVFWTLPPIAGVVSAMLTLPQASLDARALHVVAAVGPVVCIGWAIALSVGMLVDRLLRRLAVSFPPQSDVGALRTVVPPSLAVSHSRVVVFSALSAILVALGGVTMHAPATGGAFALDAVGFTVLLAGASVLLAISSAAAMTLGQTPGRDISSIAGRLDAIGHDVRGTMAAPVVVTSADEVGDLMRELEELRAQLHDELSLYQSALDKTEAADARKSDFLSAVSHELRTPLNVIGGFAQLLLEAQDPQLTPAQAEDVELIRAGGTQLLELINDILDMSMIESGELRLAFTTTDVADVIRTVVKIHQPLVSHSGVTLQAEIGPDLPQVVCDRRRLRQILTNLVSNAIKFTERGTITVRAAHDPRKEEVVIRCIDTGVGIGDEDLDTIFEEYRQVGSVKRRSKGTGLGLAIARRIAAHHGGVLTVASTIGKGSTFTLRLPLDPPDRKTTTIDMTEEAARTMAATFADWFSPRPTGGQA